MKKTFQFPNQGTALVFSYYALEKDGVTATSSVEGDNNSIVVLFAAEATSREIRAVTGLASFNHGKVCRT
jgi:hypothetical protein